MKKNHKNLSNNVERFSPNVNIGLNDNQVASRKNDGLVNYSSKKYSKSYFSIFFENICTFFNLLGLIVALALVYAKAEIFDFVFVLVFLANLTIGIVQEIRAKISIDKLSLTAENDSVVIRNGQSVKIKSKDIVLDDVIKLGLGSQVPTDSIILEGFVEVNESLLTGESVPVKKSKGELLYAGSFITSGTCIVQAKCVGKDNYVEILSEKAKKYKKPYSELINSLKTIIKAISFVIVPVGILYFSKSAFIQGVDIPKSIQNTSTVVIGMIPSGMFLLTSLALAVGIIKLAKHNTLVQDLYSLETLARVDTICFDKTGTITDGNMKLKEIISLSNDNYDFDKIISSMLGTLNDNNQTALALQNKFGKQIYYKAIATLPFNSARKLSSVSFEDVGTYAFGAPEYVLDNTSYKSIENDINKFTNQGYRVLVLARTDSLIINDKAPSNFAPIGLIVIEDNVRLDAIETIKWFKENDVDVKVISGDNPITVSEVSKRVGINNADKYISLEGLSDEEVYNIANEYTVFGRVTPEQKAILIRAIKASGHTVAMTGDGVNDILALKEADCAITVASGSEATRNVSHLVLMDNNFSSMPKVVHEGRRVINNVKRSSSLYLMKTFFTMLLAIITFCLPYMDHYPFTLSQMNVLEIFVIGLPSFFLSFQPNDERVKGSFISTVVFKSLPGALLMVISVCIIEILSRALGIFPLDTYSTMQIMALTFAGVINLSAICKPFNKYRTTLFLFSLFAITLIFVYTTIFGLPMLNLVSLSPFNTHWHHILMLVGVILFALVIESQIHKLVGKITDKIDNKKQSTN